LNLGLIAMPRTLVLAVELILLSQKGDGSAAAPSSFTQKTLCEQKICVLLCTKGVFQQVCAEPE
jgi:hypothetical protein